MGNAEQWAWECFAGAHPHEAAETDWPRFVAFVRQYAPDMSDDAIRRTLNETDSVRHDATPERLAHDA